MVDALVYEETGQYEKAIRQIERLEKELKLLNLEQQLVRVRSYIILRKMDEALESLTKLVFNYNHSPEAQLAIYTTKAEINLVLRRYDLVFDNLQYALAGLTSGPQKSSSSSQMQYYQGRYAFMMGLYLSSIRDFDQAIVLLEEGRERFKILNIKSELANYHYYRANIYFEQDHWQEGILQLGKSFAIWTMLENAYQKGVILVHMGRWDRIYGYFTRSESSLSKAIFSIRVMRKDRLLGDALYELVLTHLDNHDLDTATTFADEIFRPQGDSTPYLDDDRYQFLQARLAAQSERLHERLTTVERFQKILRIENLDFEIQTSTLICLATVLTEEYQMAHSAQGFIEILNLVERLDGYARTRESLFLTFEVIRLTAGLHEAINEMGKAIELSDAAKKLATIIDIPRFRQPNLKHDEVIKRSAEQNQQTLSPDPQFYYGNDFYPSEEESEPKSETALIEISTTDFLTLNLKRHQLIKMLQADPNLPDEFVRSIYFLQKDLRSIKLSIETIEATNRIENETYVPVMSLVDPLLIFTKLQDQSQLAIKRKHLVFSKIKTSQQKEVNIDLTLFSLILENLIENASKFTVSGGLVQIELKKTKKRYKIKIFNDAEVLDADDVNKAVQPYYCVDAIDSRLRDSLGLGLNFVNLAVKYLRGSLNVTQSMQEPNQFQITLIFPVS
ncbi:MAG: ATP-binding protein [Candidatus Heimdallarchaeota archaeon]|nr:ATP-binding protein [Candidatus Heimdallarchaeota archaeon]